MSTQTRIKRPQAPPTGIYYEDVPSDGHVKGIKDGQFVNVIPEGTGTGIYEVVSLDDSINVTHTGSRVNVEVAYVAPTESIVFDYTAGKEYAKGAEIFYNGKLWRANATFTAPANFEVTDWEELADVTTIPDFTPGKYYVTGEPIVHDGNQYRAKADFTSSSSFNEDDWELISSPAGIPDFEANESYKQYQVVTVNDLIYRAKADFISGATFDPNDWEKLSYSQFEEDELGLIKGASGNVPNPSYRGTGTESEMNAVVNPMSNDFFERTDDTSASAEGTVWVYANDLWTQTLSPIGDPVYPKTTIDYGAVIAQPDGTGRVTTAIDWSMYGALDSRISIISGQLLPLKVDKVDGKGLSTEDYTTAEKTKLDGIEDGSEANVQSDWTEADNTKDEYIKNKPDLMPIATTGNSADASYDNSSTTLSATDVQSAVDELFSNLGDYVELANIPVQTNPNWRGIVPDATGMNAIPNPQQGDICYRNDTATEWSYGGTTWSDTGQPQGTTPDMITAVLSNWRISTISDTDITVIATYADITTGYTVQRIIRIPQSTLTQTGLMPASEKTRQQTQDTRLTTLESLGRYLGSVDNAFTSQQEYKVDDAIINDGGAGYRQDDYLFLPGFQLPVWQVMGVDVGGKITAIVQLRDGYWNNNDPAGTAVPVLGGFGSGATFDIISEVKTGNTLASLSTASAAAGSYAYVAHDETRQNRYCRYIWDGSNFVFDTELELTYIPIATNTETGVVRGNPSSTAWDGSITVDAQGMLWLQDIQLIKNSIADVPRLPTTSTAGKFLTSTSTSGVVEWGDVPTETPKVTLPEATGVLGKVPIAKVANISVNGTPSAQFDYVDLPSSESFVKSVATILPDSSGNVPDRQFVTLAQYNALVTAGTVDTNKLYFITDSPLSSAVTAAPADGKFYAQRDGVWVEWPKVIQTTYVTDGAATTLAEGTEIYVVDSLT
jgi:hypothetical protein